MFTDTYLVADNFETLAAFCAYFRNVIGPVQGLEAISEYTDENGEIHSAQGARGNPQKFYACVRAPFAVEPPADISAIDAEEGILVVGVWA